MQCILSLFISCAVPFAWLGAETVCAEPQGETDAWVAPMREAHARFSGQAGTLALFGDSITVSMAFWAPLSSEPRGLSDELVADLEIVKNHQRPECWRSWRGADFGSDGGMTVRWAHENVATWLQELNPEVAVILFGTNDLTQLEADEYDVKLRDVAKTCMANGTIVILTTLPPRHGLVERSADFAKVVRSAASDLKVPLVDYHAEILERRPEDWDGALEQFQNAPGDEYNVPTLIARDGVHPSNPRDFQDYSDASLDRNGYALRNALTLRAYAAVIEKVLQSPD
jgi:hypothetical protein